jgi:hypothetical protein
MCVFQAQPLLKATILAITIFVASNRAVAAQANVLDRIQARQRPNNRRAIDGAPCGPMSLNGTDPVTAAAEAAVLLVGNAAVTVVPGTPNMTTSPGFGLIDQWESGHAFSSLFPTGELQFILSKSAAYLIFLDVQVPSSLQADTARRAIASRMTKAAFHTPSEHLEMPTLICSFLATRPMMPRSLNSTSSHPSMEPSPSATFSPRRSTTNTSIRASTMSLASTSTAKTSPWPAAYPSASTT